jgi:hypothetical protein
MVEEMYFSNLSYLWHVVLIFHYGRTEHHKHCRRTFWHFHVELLCGLWDFLCYEFSNHTNGRLYQLWILYYGQFQHGISILVLKETLFTKLALMLHFFCGNCYVKVCNFLFTSLFYKFAILYNLEKMSQNSLG